MYTVSSIPSNLQPSLYDCKDNAAWCTAIDLALTEAGRLCGVDLEDFCDVSTAAVSEGYLDMYSDLVPVLLGIGSANEVTSFEALSEQAQNELKMQALCSLALTVYCDLGEELDLEARVSEGLESGDLTEYDAAALWAIWEFAQASDFAPY